MRSALTLIPFSILRSIAKSPISIRIRLNTASRGVCHRYSCFMRVTRRVRSAGKRVSRQLQVLSGRSSSCGLCTQTIHSLT
jgi:hypothetical protein